MVYQRGNQREGSPHYVLLYSDEENSRDDNIPLQSRKKPTSQPRKVEVINVQLKTEDTLQALALRYRCTMSELKRINKIHKENEIHARRIIKIPVQPFSLLIETLEQNQSTEESWSEVSTSASNEQTTSTEMSNPLTEIKKKSVIEPPKAEINTIILNSVCEPLSIYNNSNSLEITSTECDQLLESAEDSSIEPHITETFKCSGDDCGLSWTQLVGFSLLLGFAGLIIYILHIVEKSNHSNHSIISH